MTTITLLQAKSDFWRVQGLHWQGTATDGTVNYLADTTLQNLLTDDFPFATDRRQIRITNGAADGDIRQVTQIDREQARVSPNRSFSAAIAEGDIYEVWGASIYGGSSLTNLFNDVLRKMRPRTQTRLSVEWQQREYDITTFADAPSDVIALWKRRMNNVVGGDFQAIPVNDWTPYRLDGAGTPEMVLRFDHPPSVSPTTALDGALNNSDTTITVDATADTPSPDTDFPASGRLVIDNELIDYTGTTATTFTGCTRGVENSVAASHSDDAKVDLATGSYYFLEHHGPFTALADDASTVDAIYRDWVVWEAVYEFARQKSRAPEADRTYWTALLAAAGQELSILRPTFMPRYPTIIRATDY